MSDSENEHESNQNVAATTSTRRVRPESEEIDDDGVKPEIATSDPKVVSNPNPESNSSDRIGGMSIYYSEGWIVDATAQYMGSRVRRLYSNGVMGDGQIVAYLPAEANDGQALWHMRFDDDDEEDLSENEVSI